MEETVRVIVVDDNPDVGESLGHLIGAETGLHFVGHLDSADALLESVRTHSPDVLVLDARMPGKDSIVALRELALAFPDVRVIVYSGFDEPPMIEAAMDAGAWGWVLKAQNPQSILGAIRTVAAGKPVFPRPGVWTTSP